MFACWLLVGCSTTWNISDPLYYTQEEIWDATYNVLLKRYEILRAQRQEGEIETDWQFHRANFYMKSRRHKVHVKIEPYVEKETDKVAEPGDKVTEPKKAYVVKLRAPLEENRDIDNPEIMAGATWIPIGSHQEQEGLLQGFIKSVLAARYQKSDDKSTEDEEASEPGPKVPEPTAKLPDSWEP